jgi:hypothetical protein
MILRRISGIVRKAGKQIRFVNNLGAELSPLSHPAMRRVLADLR